MEVTFMTLNDNVAIIQAEYILKKINALDLNRETKEKLLEEVIGYIKNSNS